MPEIDSQKTTYRYIELRIENLRNWVYEKKEDKTILFCETKRKAERMMDKLKKEGVRAEIEQQASQASTRATARFMWTTVQPAVARKNFQKIRDAAMFKKLKV